MPSSLPIPLPTYCTLFCHQLFYFIYLFTQHAFFLQDYLLDVLLLAAETHDLQTDKPNYLQHNPSIALF